MNDPSDEKKEDSFASESAQPGSGGPSDGDDDHDAGVDRGDAIDWFADECVVVKEQCAIAVYTNARGGIVLRAERAWYQEEDTVIVLTAPGAAYRLIEAIKKELDMLKSERSG